MILVMKSKLVYLINILVAGLVLATTCSGNPAFTTQVHIIEIGPNMFNWSTSETRDYRYHPSLVGLPDLPSWLTYKYSKSHRSGFLYGVPPSPSTTKIEIVALSRETYRTKMRIIDIEVSRKIEPAERRVELKIDNLNVEDLFDNDRVAELKSVITRILWPESKRDLYMTFLASAVTLGARLPLSPQDGEGLVVHLGSTAEFSTSLTELQEEVSPLLKLGSCPRDYRRASVDRHFRQAGFALDWCAFRLREMGSESAEVGSPPAWQSGAGWELKERSSIPVRLYSRDLLATLVSPIAVLLVLVLLLSFILCFHHDTMGKECNDEPESKLVQYEAVQRATSTLRSMSNNRETPQPTTTVQSVQKSEEDSSRPSPPPYGATRRLLHTMDS